MMFSIKPQHAASIKTIAKRNGWRCTIAGGSSAQGLLTVVLDMTDTPQPRFAPAKTVRWVKDDQSAQAAINAINLVIKVERYTEPDGTICLIIHRYVKAVKPAYTPPATMPRINPHARYIGANSFWHQGGNW